MLNLYFEIAHVHIGICCDAPDCTDGIRALVALYERYAENADTAIAADLNFSIAPLNSGAALSCNGEDIWQGEDSGEVVAAFEWAFYNKVIDALYPQFVSLHAATVYWQGHGITIAGISGAGKSSLCTAALLNGADYFSDEYSLLDEEGRITPFPRPLQWGGTEHPAFPQHLMHDSGLFGEGRYSFTGRDGQEITSLLWHPKHLGRTPASLSLLLLPRFDAAMEGASSKPVARSQALMELAAEMHHKLPVQDRLRELHHRIPEHTRFVRLEFSDVHLAWGRVEKFLTGG